jgi:succinoglycan biosynthesis protein ExoM
VEQIMSVPDSNPVLCSVCVATYRRPDLLKRLLTSLVKQTFPDGVEMEIIVVDNDVEKSAENLVCGFQDLSAVPLHYFVEPVKSISLARNLAIKAAHGQYLLFIDDDEKASPEWLLHLLKTLKRYDADAVFGQVLPEFNRDTPAWMQNNELFAYTVTVTGCKALDKYAGNCIIKASLLKQMEAPFDPRYGSTGGEDTHLFDRLEQEGARFFYCREAWVAEYLPPARTCLSYLLRRGFKGGNAHTRRMIEQAGSTQSSLRAFMVVKSLFYGSVSLLCVVLCIPSPLHRTRWLIKLASNFGRLGAALGWNYRAYR